MTHLRVPTSFQIFVHASPGPALLYSPGPIPSASARCISARSPPTSWNWASCDWNEKAKEKLWLWFEGLLWTFSGRILPYDTEASLICARMYSPDPKSLRDSMIAANTRDFELTGVKLFNPWEPEPLKALSTIHQPAQA